MSSFSLFRALIAPIALTLCAASAQAQSWTSTVDGPGGLAVASICQPGADGLVCLNLMCSDDQDLGFALQTSFPVTEDIAGNIVVDRGAPAQMLFAAPTNPGAPSVAKWGQRNHENLVAAMKKGRAVYLNYDLGQGMRNVTLSLRGSSRALNVVMDACPKPLPKVPDPVAMVLEAVAPICAEVGQLPPVAGELAEDLITYPDLDGDGRDDAVIGWEYAPCGYSRMYCGSAGCPTSFLRQTEDGEFAVAQGGHAHGYQILPGLQGRNDLRLFLHGSVCDRVGAMGCEMLFRWTTDGRLELLAKY